MDINTYLSRREAILTRLACEVSYLLDDLAWGRNGAMSRFKVQWQNINVKLAELERERATERYDFEKPPMDFRVSGG